MSTSVLPERRTNAPAPTHAAGSAGAGLASWRIMLRMARRDIQRYRGRALLSALLIALPLVILTAGGTIIMTNSISAVEAVPMKMGKAQALLMEPGSDALSQDATGNMSTVAGAQDGSTTAPALPLPGPGALPRKIERLTGGTLLPVGRAGVRVVVGDRRINASVLGIDGRASVYGPMATLTSGRWPAADDEVAVSNAGSALRIPDHGTLQISFSGVLRSMKVVGTVDTPQRESLVMLPSSPGVGPAGYLLDRNAPVTWAEVLKLNRYGIAVMSSYLARHPDQAHPQGWLADTNSTSTSRLAPLIALVLTGVVIVTMLLAGPAFTTSAARHRRSLGQLASNGATAPMLRRYVLAQAIWLGAAAALLALGIGVIAGIVAVKAIQWYNPQSVWGPLDVPWKYAALIVGLAILSSLAAALAPAVHASRVSVLEVLRGRVTKSKVRAGWPVIGLIVAVGGGVIIVSTLVSTSLAGGETKVVAGSVALFGGVLVCVPWLMAQLAKAARALPVTGRIALRDIGRQRGRAVSGVGAVFATVAVLSAVLIAGTSDGIDQKRMYMPQAPMGTGFVTAPSKDLAGIAITARQVAPEVHVTTVSNLGQSSQNNASSRTTQGNWDPSAASNTQNAWTLQLVPPGCARADLEKPQCISATTLSGQVLVLPADSIATLTDISSGQRALLDRGGMIVADRSAFDQTWRNPVTSGKVDLVIGTTGLNSNGSPTPIRQTSSAALSAALIGTADLKERRSGGYLFPSLYGSYGALITAETAKAHGWPTTPVELDLWQPGGTVSKAAEQNISDRLPDNGYIHVERGYVSQTERVLWILTIALGLIVLVTITIGTALVQAESRPDQATLAAIGATGRTRRAIAAWHALFIGLIGALIGVAVGAVPGIAACWPLTGQNRSSNGSTMPVIVAIPWLNLAIIVLLVPLLSALIAAAITRRAPTLTRRTD